MIDAKYPIGLRDGQSGVSHAVFKPQDGGNTAVTGATTYTVPANTVCIRIATTTAGNINFPAWGATADPGSSNATYFPIGVEYMHVNPGMVLNVAAGYIGQISSIE